MTRTAELDGVRIAYVDTGAGLPLLCLHGGMGIDGRSLHAPGILELAAHGIRLLIPDQRGHGKSRSYDDAELNHATWATDARQLATHVGLTRLAILGHSYGGFLALEYAVRWPDTLTHLILVATSAGPIHVHCPVLSTDIQVREYFGERWPLFFHGENKHWDLFNNLTFSASAFNAAFARELPNYDLRDRVANLDTPMLLVVGREDAYLPHMEWLAEHARRATLCVMNEVGHFPFVEAPHEFVRTVASFLASTGDAA